MTRYAERKKIRPNQTKYPHINGKTLLESMGVVGMGVFVIPNMAVS